jgi:hypothetical protein
VIELRVGGKIGRDDQGAYEMATERANDLRAFRQYIDEYLSNGGSQMTLDQALIYWEAENQTDEEREETLKAIEQGLLDVAAGRARPFDDFDREFRSRHGLPPRS